MTMTRTPETPLTGRQARQITKKFTAQLVGRHERGPDRKVRRGSVDIDDRRARVSRPIADGTKVGALAWIDCLQKAVSEWDDMERQKQGGRPLGLHGLRVLEVLLGRRGVVALDFRTGRLDPALDTIARAAGVCRTTVVRALARMRAMGILDWIRRSETTGATGQAAPQRRQVSNAYWFTPELLPARVLKRLRDLVARRALHRRGTTPTAAAPPAPPRPTSPELAAALDRLGRGLSASTPNGEYPCSGVKG
jgi:hypothetical protein